MNAIHERLEGIARTVFDDDGLVLTADTTARDVPGWDSLGHVNFMYSIEDEFGVQFSEEEFVGFASIGELGLLLERKLDTARSSETLER